MEAKLAALLRENPPTERAGAISRNAFDEMVRAHQRRIHRILMALVHDPGAADTLTQEVFLRAFEKRTTVRGEASVGTWLVRIALNLAPLW